MWVPSGWKKGAPGLERWVVNRDCAVPIARWSGGSFFSGFLFWLPRGCLVLILVSRGFVAERPRGAVREQEHERRTVRDVHSGVVLKCNCGAFERGFKSRIGLIGDKLQ